MTVWMWSFLFLYYNCLGGNNSKCLWKCDSSWEFCSVLILWYTNEWAAAAMLSVSTSLLMVMTDDVCCKYWKSLLAWYRQLSVGLKTGSDCSDCLEATAVAAWSASHFYWETIVCIIFCCHNILRTIAVILKSPLCDFSIMSINMKKKRFCT